MHCGINKNFEIPRKFSKYTKKYCGDFNPVIGNTAVKSLHYQLPICLLFYRQVFLGI
jgi:hypothetical protein